MIFTLSYKNFVVLNTQNQNVKSLKIKTLSMLLPSIFSLTFLGFATNHCFLTLFIHVEGKSTVQKIT